MDQYIWCTIPKVQRLAIAFKSYQLIKYILKPGPETREKIPWWELLTSLQLSQQHPVAIDFFPWPEVRDRLIINHAYYLGKCDFFSCTQEYLFSNWPYGIRDCFVLDDQSTYRPSQAFIQHVNSLTNWSMCPAFFERYPEFIGIIPPASAAWEGTETWRA
ncbi:hypothetical protein BDV29DRAFT_129628 [Aspergillus leporis]|uniref:Uncharacterized protein n=1 Tax=Aspergillus leporis TaxID=41062 RepID=A0A5N5XDC4_9EURO|nr:hypothetical protein BDV29DRAFT_129628 [Aspergillus leporis]